MSWPIVRGMPAETPFIFIESMRLDIGFCSKRGRIMSVYWPIVLHTNAKKATLVRDKPIVNTSLPIMTITIENLIDYVKREICYLRYLFFIFGIYVRVIKGYNMLLYRVCTFQ